MDGWEQMALVLGLAVLAGLILGPIAFFVTLGLPRRVDELERRNLALSQIAAAAQTREYLLLARLAMLETGAAPVIEKAAVPDRPAVVAEPVPLAKPAPMVALARVPEASATTPDPIAPPPLARTVPDMPAKPDMPRQPAPVRSLEERLGARWTVWVGGVALALGAVLLVRYSIEMGLIGPGVRIILSLLLAAVLIVAGEFLRRRDQADLSSKASDIPAVLTAAGTIAAFGAIYAAHALYGFVGPAIAFVALGATGIACMLLAALHGPALAGLGLVGALAVPLLVASHDPDPWIVTAYVAIVVAAAYGLARIRGWRWLAIAGAAGAFLWGLVFALGLGTSSVPLFAASMSHASLHVALALLVFGLPQRGGAVQAPARLGLLASIVPSVLAVPALLLLYAAIWHQFDLSWVFFASIVVAILAAGGRAMPAATGTLVAAGLLACAIMAIWPWNFQTDPDDGLAMLSAQGRFIVFGGLSGAGVALAAASGLWARQPVQARISLIQAGVASVTPLAALTLAWWQLDDAFPANVFAALAAALGVAFVGAATLLKTRPGAPASLGLGSFAAAAIAALALALVFLLDRGMLTVALALAAAGTALVAARLQIPALRWCVAALGLIIAARLAWDPRIAGDQLGSVPVLNWLLFGYGVPALSFALAAIWLRGPHEDVPLRLSQALAILFAALLVFFEIRHALNGGNAFARSSSLVEQGLMSTSALGFAIVTTRLDMARFGIVFRLASLGFGIVAFATALIGLGLLQNPFFTDEPVEGGRFFNAILLAYALPGLLALLLSRLSRHVRPGWYGLGAALLALVLLFATASLEVRRGFMAARIGFERGFDDTEFYTYSAVWLVMGIVLLAYGIWRNIQEARFVSGLFVVGAALKVFLFDLAGLGGILRALSFIGLGFVLIGIGLVYQKLVFRRAGGLKQNT